MDVSMANDNSLRLGVSLRDSSTPSSKAPGQAPKLILFDIDGTLSTGGMFTKSLAIAIEDILKQGITQSGLEERVKLGRTPRQELVLMADAAKVPRDKQDEVVEQILARAATHFKDELSAAPLTVFAGVAEFLGQLNVRDDIVLGIVTNNPKEIMQIKLDAGRLQGYFLSHGIMVCGDDGSSKSELVEVAIRKAQDALHLKLDRSRIFYFGDQVSDILAGKLAGVVAIGVATGRSSFNELADAGADHVLHDLSDVKSVMAIINGANAHIKHKQVKI